MPQGQPRATRQPLEGTRSSGEATKPHQPAQPQQLAVCTQRQPSDAAQAPAAITPTSNTECGAHCMSGQVPMQTVPAVSSSAVLPTSTASSCQPAASGDAGAAAAHPPQQGGAAAPRGRKGGAAGDAQSPPAGAPKGGRRSRSAATGKKRPREDPLLKAMERYLESQAKKGDHGDTPPEAQPQRPQRPRTAAGTKKSCSTSGNSCGSQPSEEGGPHRGASGIALDITGLQLASPSKAAAAAGAAKATATGVMLGAGDLGGGGLEGMFGAVSEEGMLEAVTHGLALAGAEATAAVFGPQITLHQHFSSLQEQLEAGFGEEIGAIMAEAAALGVGGPYGALPAPQAPVTLKELEEARRQLAATARPFPTGYRWVSPMPLTEEHFGPLGGAPGASDSTHLGGGGSSRGAVAARAPASTAKGNKNVVAPYRLPVPLDGSGGTAAGGGGGQRQRQGGGGSGRTRYTFRSARGKRKKEAGYVSFDSEDDSEEEAVDDDIRDADVQEADLYSEEEEDEEELAEPEPSLPSSAGASAGAARASTKPYRQPVPLQQLHQPAAPGPGALQRVPSADGVVRVSTGAAPRGRPPGTGKKQQQAAAAAQRTTAAAATGLRRSATLPAHLGSRTAPGPAGMRGSETPRVGTLGATGLSPLLSPTLASLFMPDQALPGASSQPIDLNADLDHLLGDFDFSNDAVLLVPKIEPACIAATSAQVEASMAEAASFVEHPSIPATAAAAAAVVAQSAAAAAMSGWPALAAAMGASLLNPPLPAGRLGAPQPGAAIMRAVSAPQLPAGARNTTAPEAAAGVGGEGGPSRAASGGPCVSVGGGVIPTATGATTTAATEEGTLPMEEGLLPNPHERLDLAQALGVHRTPLGSPLLQGLMSPTALGQLLDSW